MYNLSNNNILTIVLTLLIIKGRLLVINGLKEFTIWITVVLGNRIVFKHILLTDILPTAFLLKDFTSGHFANQ